MQNDKKIKLALISGLSLVLIAGLIIHKVSKKEGGDPASSEEVAITEGIHSADETAAIVKSGEEESDSPAVHSGHIGAKVPTAVMPDTSSEIAKEIKKEEEKNNCFTLTFQHRKLASHADGEACMHHRNLLTLKHKKFEKGSLCVRVNGTPVNYQFVKGRSDQIVIGPIAGPQSEVTARYCLTKKCLENCKVPKDEFMAAIGGLAGSGSGEMGVWDPNDPNAKDQDVTQQIGQELQRALAESSDLSLFKDWETRKEDASCKI